MLRFYLRILISVLCFFSLGMKDSMGPLKSLLVASTVNGLGHIILCTMLGYGIVGAAWATMTSQVFLDELIFTDFRSSLPLDGNSFI